MKSGTKLGHYEILSAIGKGGMGSVSRVSRQRIVWTVLALVTLIEVSGMAAVGNAQDIGSRIDTYLAEQIRVDGRPGLSVAVIQHGDVIYSGAHGVRQLGGNEELTPQHVFHFASVSKSFVATAIVQLVEQGKMDLDDSVTEFLPYFSMSDEGFRDITIRQMLNHTSGMPDVEDYAWNNPEFDDGAAERSVRAMASEQLLWAPGTGYEYSNMAFDVIGDVIAKASGQSFEAYMRTNILEPLGMDDSSFIFPEINEALRTTGHVGDPAQVSDVYPYNRRHAPSSTLNSSVVDMSRWILVNLNRGELDGRRILSMDSHNLLWTPTVQIPSDQFVFPNRSEYGLGWYIGEYVGHRIVSHGGRDTGFTSLVLLLPDDEIGLVVTSNWDQPSLTIARGVLDLVLGAGEP